MQFAIIAHLVWHMSAAPHFQEPQERFSTLPQIRVRRVGGGGRFAQTRRARSGSEVGANPSDTAGPRAAHESLLQLPKTGGPQECEERAPPGTAADPSVPETRTQVAENKAQGTRVDDTLAPFGRRKRRKAENGRRVLFREGTSRGAEGEKAPFENGASLLDE